MAPTRHGVYGTGVDGTRGPTIHIPDPVEQEARERVQLWLGFLSLGLWFLVSFGLVAALNLPAYGRGAPIIMAGFLGLALSALPWLWYRRLVSTETDRRRARHRHT